MTRQAVWIAAAFALAVPCVHAQQGGPGAAPQTPKTAKASAPIDLTGYWVSVVTEDWRWRMVTPSKGDYAGVPITQAAKDLADTWNPGKDDAAGEQCRSYGAPALMRVPERVRIGWENENTLKVETDAGMQTRLFHFGDWKSPGGPPKWQGDSIARWEMPRASIVGGGAAATPRSGTLKVVTDHLRPGYLRKNGLPYSARALLTEYWDVFREPNGDQWLVITTLVEDPIYLQGQWVTSLHFKREPDGARWDPTPCSSRW
ncbi:MAG: hypothetical protein M3N93_12785 [Acidobacteriota bacterium]|nr:hypothetical protein [Acidobacteriota bacterium]